MRLASTIDLPARSNNRREATFHAFSSTAVDALRVASHTPRHARTLETIDRSARRGAALPAHERVVLLPLGVLGAVGTGPAADAGLRDVSRRDRRRMSARSRRRRDLSAAARRARARAARPRSHLEQRTGREGWEALRSAARVD